MLINSPKAGHNGSGRAAIQNQAVQLKSLCPYHGADPAGWGETEGELVKVSERASVNHSSAVCKSGETFL